jgi:predicted nucleic acid-binding protein
MLLLDSTFLIDLHDQLRKGTGTALDFMRRHRTEAMVITPISASEYSAGIRHDRESRRFLRRFRLVPIGRDLALSAGRLDRQQSERGLRLGENDTWQAAIALHLDLILVSDDLGFEKVPLLRRMTHRQ